MNELPTVTPAGGVPMPRMLYGTAWKKEATAALVETALRAGFRGIDTACQPRHYDEAGVGAGIAALLGEGLGRDELYVQTKFSPPGAHDPARMPYDPRAPIREQVEQSFAVSVENLKMSRLDGLVLHSPLPTGAATLEAWRALEALVERGGVRQIGISNCYSPDLLRSLYDAAAVKPAIVQNRFYRETGYDVGIRAFCREHGIVYQCFWTLTANPQLLAAPVLRSVARRHGCTPAQVLFRYLTQQDVVPLTGTTNERHMQADLAIFGFELDTDEQNAVAALLD